MAHHITDVHFDCSFTIKLNFQQHIFSKINVSSSVLFHTLLEVISTSLALFISILALVRYCSKKMMSYYLSVLAFWERRYYKPFTVFFHTPL